MGDMDNRDSVLLLLLIVNAKHDRKTKAKTGTT